MLADVPPDAWRWEATAAHRTLIERDTAGARLLKESGPLARLRITKQGRLAWSAALAHAPLAYRGQTQAGSPLATDSRHLEAEAGVRWRPVSSFDWGAPSLSFDALWFRRSIAATTSAASLEERSMLWMPGLAWTSPAWTTNAAQLSLEARWRISVRHDLAVDYGGLFDRSSLRGGRRSEFTLRAVAALPQGWSASLHWQAARQRESGLAPIFRSGVAAGTVHQPRIEVDDVGLTLSRSF